MTEEVSRVLKSVETADNEAYGEILEWWSAGGHKIKDKLGSLTRALQQGKSSHSAMEVRCFDGSTKTILSSTLAITGT